LTAISRWKRIKTTEYWKDATLAERRAKLREVWRRIVTLLDAEIAGVAEALPPPEADMKGRALKAYEDRLDAVICAHVAIRALEGEAKAYGDDVSAIWVPLLRLSETASEGAPRVY
jgi:predicted RNase H-like nuclease